MIDRVRERGARKTAEQIEAYWREKGFPQIKCRLQQRGEMWDVRSNLVHYFRWNDWLTERGGPANG